MSALAITWFGHATFVVTTPGGKRIVFDPWLTNPKAPAGAKIDKADVICVTHGHSDHTTDVLPVARGTGAPVVAVFELANYFQSKGVKDVVPMGSGGTAISPAFADAFDPAFARTYRWEALSTGRRRRGWIKRRANRA